jgi:hypothetical protein
MPIHDELLADHFMKAAGIAAVRRNPRQGARPRSDRVVGTSLGAELDALAAMPAPERMAVIDRAAGAAISATQVNAEPQLR